jgi:TP901 family phage tail tape measure protein
MPVKLGTGYVNVLPEFKGFGSKVSAGLTKYLSLPLAAVGAASIKMALDFDQSMTKVAALTQGGAKDVKLLHDRVLDLGVATAQGPKELADALYFVESAGFHGEKAMNLLTIAAKDAASGLGTTATVADLLTSAVNAYAGSGLKAAKVSDQLIAAVTAGKLPAEDLAGSLGAILPLASKLDISFAQVVATVAELSKQGIPASRSITGLRFAMTALVNPTTAARAEMKDLGVKASEVSKMIQSGSPTSLIDTLNFLFEAADGNTAAFAKMVGGTRGLATTLPLLGNKLADTKAVLDQVTNATGKTNEAFKTTAESAAFKAKQALAQLEDAAIRLGEALLPIFVQVAHVVGSVAEAFSHLPKGIQGTIVKVGLLLFALGPLVRITSALISVGTKLVGVFTAEAAAAGTAAAASDGLVLSWGAGATAAGEVTTATVGLSTVLAPLAGLALGVAAGFAAANDQQSQWRKLTADTAKDLETSSSGWDHYKTALDNATHSAKDIALAGKGAGIAAAKTKGDTDAVTSAYRIANGVMLQWLHNLQDATGGLTRVNRKTLEAYLAAHDLAGAIDFLHRIYDGYVADLPKGVRHLGAMSDELSNQKEKADLLGASVDSLGNKVNHLPSQKTIDIRADVTRALNGINSVSASANALISHPYTIIINEVTHKLGLGPSTGGLIGAGGKISMRGYASGGSVPGGGYGGGDRIPMFLEPGEFVLRKEAVRALGLANARRLNESDRQAPAPAASAPAPAPAPAAPPAPSWDRQMLVTELDHAVGKVTVEIPITVTTPSGDTIVSELRRYKLRRLMKEGVSIPL